MYRHFPISAFHAAPGSRENHACMLSAARHDAKYLIEQPSGPLSARWPYEQQSFRLVTNNRAIVAKCAIKRNPGPQDFFLKVHVQADGDDRQDEQVCPHSVSWNLVKQTVSMKAPPEPSRVQAVLSMLKPNIVYNRYMCPERCRSRGICVHYSYVLGGRYAPDGLICNSCRASCKEQGLTTDRRCAMHNRSGVSCYTQNLAEDYLATKPQAAAASERLQRSLKDDWNVS